MIINNQIQRIGTISSDNNIDMKITNDPKIFMMLSSNIYEYKIRAIIRELSCNAVDAHTAANNPEPFFVHIPTQLEPFFYVEDFGIGLSEDEVKEIYTVYGESTKTKSNDMIGALGLGSKSPFSYTDIFEVRTRKDGRELIYIVSKGEQFSFTKISDKETTEPNGVRVKFDVSRNDYYEFKREFGYVMKFFKQVPNNNYKITDENLNKVTETEFYTYNGANPPDGREFTCVMGQVPYTTKFSEDKFQNYLTRQGLDEKTINVYLKMVSYIFPQYVMYEMGSLEFVPSRERLALTPSCIDAIYSKLYELYSEKYNQYTENKNTAKTPYDVIQLIKDFPFAKSDTFTIEGVEVQGERIYNPESWYSRSISPSILFELEQTIVQEHKLIGERNLFAINTINTDKNNRLSLLHLMNTGYDKLNGLGDIVVIYRDYKLDYRRVSTIIRDAKYIISETLELKNPIFVFVDDKKLVNQLSDFLSYYMFKNVHVKGLGEILRCTNIGVQAVKTPRAKSKRSKIAKNEVRAMVHNGNGFFEEIVELTDKTFYVDIYNGFHRVFSNIFGTIVLKRDLIADYVKRGYTIILKNSKSARKIESNNIQSLIKLLEIEPKMYHTCLINIYKSQIFGYYSKDIMKRVTLRKLNKFFTERFDLDFVEYKFKEAIKNQDIIDRFNLQQIIDIAENHKYNEQILDKYSEYFDVLSPSYHKYDEVFNIVMKNILSEEDKQRLL